jgi:ankyrin repeat protein
MEEVCIFALKSAIHNDKLDNETRFRIIQTCIEYGIDLKNILTLNELLTAISYYHYPLAELLVKSGIDVSANNNELIIEVIDRCDNMAIDHAISLDLLRFLIDCGADPCARDNEPICLVCRIHPHRTDLIQFLVDMGADPCARNNEPICNISGSYYTAEGIPFLLSLGADPRAQNDTPLCLVCHTNDKGSIELPALLISLGADPCAQNNKPMCNACRSSNIVLVKFLIEMGATWTGPNNEPIGLLFRNPRRNLEIRRLLLENGADANTTYKNIFLMEWAVIHCDLEGISLLFEYQANLNVRPDVIKENINYKTWYEHEIPQFEEIIGLFLNKGIDISGSKNHIRGCGP